MDIGTGVAARLLAIFREELKKPVMPADHPFAHGLTINRALRIIARFWRETGIELDVNTFYVHDTIGKLIAAAAAGGDASVPKLIEIRPGAEDETLIIYAGGVSCFLEMQDLVNRLTFRGRVCGMALTQFGRSATEPALVADEVRASLQAIDSAGVNGPFRVIGYSFGGLVALELVRALAARGEKIAFFGLIDAPQSESGWPFGIWLRFMLNRARRRWTSGKPAPAERPTAATVDASVTSARRPSGPVAALRHALRPLLFRFANPRAENYPLLAPQWVGGYPPNYDAAGRQLLRMKGLYRPTVYDGPVTFYRALGGSPVDCDPKQVWPRFLPKATWVDMRGNHQSLIIGRNAATLAEDISRRL